MTILVSDRNRSKQINILNNHNVVIKVVGLYIDNVRDNQHKVSFINITGGGTRAGDYLSFGNQDVDMRNVGWVWFPIEGTPFYVHQWVDLGLNIANQ